MTTTGSSRLTPHVTTSLLRGLEERLEFPVSRPRIPVHAPFTEAEVGSVPSATAEDVEEAVVRGRHAQGSWAATPIRHRARVLSRFHDLLLDQVEVMMDLVQLEAGKARVDALEEVLDTVATTRYYLDTGPGLLRRKRRSVSLPGFTSAWEYRHPHGVVGNIAPWNYPLTLTISDVVPALLAGNSVVIKPDEKTPYSSLMGAALLEQAGLPPDVLSVVTGPGDVVGTALVGGVDFIAFTGSTAVGRTVAEQAARRLIGASLELGGKNAAIVTADADLDKAVAGIARSAFANGGQLCVTVERIYLEAGIASEFTARFVEATRALVLSADYTFEGRIGSMVDRDHLDKVHSHVEDALARGATLLTGGRPRPEVGPLFYEPTVLVDVDESMLVCRSETFGPVVALYPVGSAEEAITSANDSDYGLNFSVWTEDERQGVDIAARLRAGSVGVNDGYAATWSTFDAPLGGMKDSGMSRRHGEIGILKFTEPQTIAVQRGLPAFAPPRGMGYPRYQRLLTRFLRLAKHLPFYK